MIDFRNVTRKALQQHGIKFKTSHFIDNYEELLHNMAGGAKVKKNINTFTYQDVTLQITKTYDDDKDIKLSFATVSQKCKKDGNHYDADTCMGILFSRNSEIVSPTISEHSFAHVQSFNKTQISGETIMYAVLEYLRKLSEERHSQGLRRIKYVQLRDNAFTTMGRTCVELTKYYTITKGTAYYDRFGFVPYDINAEFVNVAGVLQLDKNLRTFKKHNLANNNWILERFPQCAKHFKNVDHTKTSIGEPIRYMFQNFPGIIAPHIDHIVNTLRLTPVNNLGWAILLTNMNDLKIDLL